MSSAEVYFGHYCPKCGTTIGVAAAAGASLRCPGCGGPMQAARGGPEVHVLANVTCKQCHSAFGLLTIVGGPLKCPSCGAPFG